MTTRLALICVSICGISPGQTSAENPRLKSALERFPKVVSNKDGIPTLQEAKVFKGKPVKAQDKSDRLAETEKFLQGLDG